VPSDRERIEGLEADARRREGHIADLEVEAEHLQRQIDGLEVDALGRHDEIAKLAADALAGDVRNAELAAEIDGLHQAMGHRAAIEQAKGVIMGAMGCGPEAAFAVLVKQSQDQNRKLWEIAVELAGAQERQPPSN
jgi:hypothetical protein